MRAHNAGITLVELIVASVVAAFVAGATLVAVSQALRARDAASDRASAWTRAHAAADSIAAAVRDTVRDGDLLFARVQVVDAGPDDAPADQLLVVTRSLRRVRPIDTGAPEGGEREAAFRIERGALWRRLDGPPDEILDGGGVAQRIAEGIDQLSIEAFDGAEWFPDWDSDSDGYPHAVRVTVRARGDDRRTEWARRVIALDRTPLPIQEEETVDEFDEAAR